MVEFRHDMYSRTTTCGCWVIEYDFTSLKHAIVQIAHIVGLSFPAPRTAILHVLISQRAAACCRCGEGA